MTFDDLLDRLWFADFEVLKYEWLLVCKNYRTHERVVFHNNPRNDIYEWINKVKPILCGYNFSGYDKYILKGIMSGLMPTDVKQLNDYIINGGKGWEFNYPERVDLPVTWDLMGHIKTFKSLKELEGNLGLSIVESNVDFNVDHKLNKEEFEELLYYCDCDVEALFSIFPFMIKAYKAKFIVAKLGNIDPEKALGMTNANLAALYLKAKKIDYDDCCRYEYPSIVDKSKIPKEFLDYIDDIVEHNDIKYTGKPPLLNVNHIDFQVGLGGGHGFTQDGLINYQRDDIVFTCDDERSDENG